MTDKVVELISYNPKPRTDPAGDLRLAVRVVGERAYNMIMLENPHLRTAFHRVSQYTGGRLLPGTDGIKPFLDDLVESAIDSYVGENPIVPMIIVVSQMLSRLFDVRVQSSTRPFPTVWNPLDMTLHEFVSTTRAREIILYTEDDQSVDGLHVSTYCEGPLLIASRIFNVTDLERVGLIHQEGAA